MKAKCIKLKLFILLLLFAVVIGMFNGGVGYAYAAINVYSNVLDDLRQDETFNIENYPSVANDYSLQLIQIAESTDGELFLYVYQPSAKTKFLTATQINMSLTESVDSTQIYNLTLLNNAGIFQKYLVEGVPVSSDEVRYYNISTIYRFFDKDIDGVTGDGNIVNKKAYGVGQYWQVITQGDTVTYKMLKVDTVEIINPFTSYIRRNKNYSNNEYFQDNYYVAFSTERNIDELLSATVSYRIQDYFYKGTDVLGFDNTAFWESSTFSNERRTQTEVYCDEVIELQQHGYNLFGIFDLNDKYSWGRIQSSSDFVKNSGVSSSDKQEIAKLQWVLMFDEVSMYRYVSDTILRSVEEAGQIIDEVSILRLEFVENGITYNLGAVSDFVSKDFNFGNTNDGTGNKSFLGYVWNCLVKMFKGIASALEIFVAVVAIIICSIIIGLLLKVLSLFVPFLVPVWEKLWAVIWFVITLPFKGIKALINKIRGE